MRRVVVRFGLLVMVSLSLGCAASRPPESFDDRPSEESSRVVALECRAASDQGCRYKGRVFPWSAWAEMMGYDSKKYAVLEVSRTGPTAVVTVVER